MGQEQNAVPTYGAETDFTYGADSDPKGTYGAGEELRFHLWGRNRALVPLMGQSLALQALMGLNRTAVATYGAGMEHITPLMGQRGAPAPLMGQQWSS